MTLRPPLWLSIAGVPLAAAAILGWLLMVFGGQRSAMIPLPGGDPESLRYFLDPGARLTLDDARKLTVEQWQRLEGTHVSSFHGDVLWLRVLLRNPASEPVHGVLENEDYFEDRVDAWVLDGGDPIHLGSGEAIAGAEKKLAGREIAFPVSLPPRSEQVVLLRMADVFGSYARLGWWREEAAFQLSRAHSGLAEGLYLGGMVALLGYNTLLWLRLRQRDIGLYVLYLGASAGFIFLARAYSPVLGFSLSSPFLELALTAAIGSSSWCLIRFAREFLEMKLLFPRLDRALKIWNNVMAGLVLVVMATVPLGPLEHSPLRVAVIFTAAAHLGLLVFALIAWRKGVWQARFFVASFGCLFAGTLPMIGVWFLKSSARDVGMRGVMIGSALEMLMLSLAVAERFAMTQRKLVEETEQRRTIEEAYADELETEVIERTRELQVAGNDKDRMLSVIGHDLRGPLTGLMRAAEVEDGALSKQVAQTGRELLLMIEDLVLWTRMRAGGRTLSTHPATALVMPAVALHHSLAGSSGVRLLLELPGELPVLTDLVLAQTLVRNLLANALKFARTQVAIRAEASPGGVSFTIGNDGPALSAEVAARLAAGVDEPMTATGGMGLRLCREICEALETRLQVANPPNGGTEFGFILKRGNLSEPHS